MIAKEEFKQWLNGIEVLAPQQNGSLQVFGLRNNSTSPLTYTTLDEALGEKILEVSEVNEGGEVPNLTVTNKGETQVFLMAGEELIGAKQNRVLNASFVVGGQSEVQVPVSCVEQGRWSYASRQFGSAGSAAHGKLRAKLSGFAGAAYKRVGRPTSDQGQVWAAVSEKLDELASPSGTGALHQAYLDHQTSLDEFYVKLSPPEGALGAVFVIGGRIAGVDVFDQVSTLQKLWRKIVRSYALDALEKTKRQDGLSRDDVHAWLEKAVDEQLFTLLFQLGAIFHPAALLSSAFVAGLVQTSR